MARIFITGSSDGLGKVAAEQLIRKGHQVVLHARNKDRKHEALNVVPGAENVLTGDLTNFEELRNLSEEANKIGPFDAVIHNAGVYHTGNKTVFAVNSLAPYMLTCLMHRPDRLIYVSSGLHFQASPHMDIQTYQKERFSYADSKLHVILLAKAIARKWPEVFANAVDPGWVPTKMGGSSAPDNLMKGAETQVWLASGNDAQARVSGRYFFHLKEKEPLSLADDLALQEKFLDLCQEITGVKLS